MLVTVVLDSVRGQEEASFLETSKGSSQDPWSKRVKLGRVGQELKCSSSWGCQWIACQCFHSKTRRFPVSHSEPCLVEGAPSHGWQRHERPGFDGGLQHPPESIEPGSCPELFALNGIMCTKLVSCNLRLKSKRSWPPYLFEKRWPRCLSFQGKLCVANPRHDLA